LECQETIAGLERYRLKVKSGPMSNIDKLEELKEADEKTETMRISIKNATNKVKHYR
jgi:hypothetical protein